MKNRSVFAVGIITLAPAFAAAAQPAESPPSQGANQTQSPPSEGANQTQSATPQPADPCAEAGKSTTAKGSSGDGANASAAASESVKKVQKNTGDHPTRTKNEPAAEEVCPTQPQ
jgi:hypothetical protein